MFLDQQFLHPTFILDQIFVWVKFFWLNFFWKKNGLMGAETENFVWSFFKLNTFDLSLVQDITRSWRSPKYITHHKT